MKFRKIVFEMPEIILIETPKEKLWNKWIKGTEDKNLLKEMFKNEKGKKKGG